MGNVNTLLTARLKKSDNSSKMAAMAKQSANGNLTSFAGMFNISELSSHEKDRLEELLYEFSQGQKDLSADLQTLIGITSEVKAINHQAALLHGERIKKAHAILTRYREGAFTAWLIAAYGNRQTPYNFMQYYAFCDAMPKTLRSRIEAMPRQAIYTLATREGSIEKKQIIVESYNGQTKVELLKLIRQHFPLADKDKRRQDIGENTVISLEKLCHSLDTNASTISRKHKITINQLLDRIRQLING